MKLEKVTYSFVLLLLATLLLTSWSPVRKSFPQALPVFLSHTCGRDDTYSNRNVVLRIQANGNLYLDEDPFSDETLMPALSRIYDQRLERVLYLSSAADISYGRVVSYIAQARALIPHLAVVLLPRETPQHRMDQSCFSYESILPATL